MRAAVYARVSTIDQHCDNQLLERRSYCEARGWSIAKEFVDHGVSGAKERRAALDDLVRDAKTRLEDVVLVCSNCHRMIHRHRPWLGIAAVRNLLQVM